MSASYPVTPDDVFEWGAEVYGHCQWSYTGRWAVALWTLRTIMFRTKYVSWGSQSAIWHKAGVSPIWCVFRRWLSESAEDDPFPNLIAIMLIQELLNLPWCLGHAWWYDVLQLQQFLRIMAWKIWKTTSASIWCIDSQQVCKTSNNNSNNFDVFVSRNHFCWTAWMCRLYERWFVSIHYMLWNRNMLICMPRITLPLWYRH